MSNCLNAISGGSLRSSRLDHSWWGRLVENAVGAHLLNQLAGFPYSLYYWRNRGWEVDFVVKTPKDIWGIEVKSGRPGSSKGSSGFLKSHPGARIMILGPQGMALEDFFRADPRELF